MQNRYQDTIPIEGYAIMLWREHRHEKLSGWFNRLMRFLKS